LPTEQWESYVTWREGIDDRLATVAAKQNRITTLYGAIIASTKAQDLPFIYSTGTDVNEYVNHVISFSEAVKQDYADLVKYKSEIQNLELEINALNSVDEGFAKVYGVSLLEQRRSLAPGYITEMEQAIKQTTSAQAELLNAQVVYLDAIDIKAQEMLKGWDGVKSEAKKQLIIGSITAALDILTATGISGSAAYKLYAGDGKILLDKTKRTTNDWWEILGLRTGQLGDYVSNWINTGKFLDGLNKYGIKSEQAGYDFVTNKIEELSGPKSNFQVLIDRLNEHLKWAKEEEDRRNNTPPNPFVPV
jgi:hypothetical protein